LIVYYIRRASLINLTGLAGSTNTTGDDQKKLDVIGNDLFIAAMKSSGIVRVLVSGEEEDVMDLMSTHRPATQSPATPSMEAAT